MIKKHQKDNSYIQLSQDSPLSNLHDDRFERVGLAKTIANSIINLSKTEHDCTNIAIYGKWGEGKTTLMNFVETILVDNGKKDNIYITHFNPWMAVDEDSLIKDFFRSISYDIKDEIGLFLQKYGKAISFAANRVADVLYDRWSILFELIGIDKSDKKTRIGEKISKTIDELKEVFTEDNIPLYIRKKELCEKIKRKNIHLLVFIDDIDRLDKNEVHAVFRLIRQVADFPNTIYMIGMDPEVVAKSLSEFFGNNIHDGRSFIDKIIQVPIYLPKISQNTLKNDVKELLQTTLTNSGEKIEEIEETINLISELITTPRQLIRYKNQIGFKIKSLAGEINLCDLCMLEAINTISPLTYNNIYVNWKRLSRTADVINTLIKKEEESESVKARFEEAINEITSEISNPQKSTCKEIINTLFPNQSYPNYSIIANKRIQSPIFFFRFFYQGVPEDQISEKGIKTFEEIIDHNRESDLIAKIDEIVEEYDYDNLNRAIQEILYRTKDNTIKSERINKFCLALCQSQICDTKTELFAKEGLFAPSLILNLLNIYMPSILKDGNIDYHSKETSLLLKQLYKKSEFNFSIALFRLINGHLNFYSSLAPDHIAPLVESFIKLPYSEQYKLQAREIKELLDGWRKYDNEGPKNYLINAVKCDSFDCTKLLSIYIKGELDAVSNGQSIIDMTYVFGTSLEPLIERLQKMNLEGSVRKALDCLSNNWRGFLKS